ncbi:hypothetical protein RF11_06679 [Thelohanellus kitauei]|uniref:Uncharacterized protein n=1 Tax=Thelohanellus kitauei TaxID=669202 RepID=A0A0C2JRN0_THEKT|nr:hypothetical protein RF11_10650 [Thelohanellus kitauei]KII74132.1 hypothetical protein RF11_06679 [Thelohanellus kitauei]
MVCPSVVKVLVFVLHFYLSHANKPPPFSHQKSLTYERFTKDRFDNYDSPISSKGGISDVRARSLFGYTILPSFDKKAVIVSAPARSYSTFYGGDIFKCQVDDFENTCKYVTDPTTLGM